VAKVVVVAAKVVAKVVVVAAKVVAKVVAMVVAMVMVERLALGTRWG
jgi:hypothetical protein